MKKMMTILCLLSVCTAAFATSLSEQAEAYVIFCGTKNDLKTFLASKGEKMTAKDVAEAIQTRAAVLNVLKTGKKGIQDLLAQGERSEAGPLGVLMTCGIIDQIKNEIQNRGCSDLKNNQVVRNSGGLPACDEIMKKMNNLNK